MSDTTSTTRNATEESAAELQARVDLLEEETQRLRAERDREKHVKHRRTAAGFALLGLFAIGGAALFPDARSVLFALAGTGLFAAVLTLWITPERFVSADVGERVYAAMARNGDAVVSELGLVGEPTYVPRESDVRLYIPQSTGHSVPAADALEETFVVGADDADRGIAFEPTGARLLDALDWNEGTVASQANLLASALVETFELATAVDVDVDITNGRATWTVSDPLYGTGEQFDHPIVSLLAVGTATAVDEPVRTDIDTGDSFTVTCRWDVDDT
ncbi:hypothetical protein GCM10027435_02900 [Haloparvum alkalitolerans]|uniref:hypothetical protein n=1 Tax=Haloparvum alkalitolerans TaxID=1042953 RepID=UPI003CF46287